MIVAPVPAVAVADSVVTVLTPTVVGGVNVIVGAVTAATTVTL